MKNFLRLSILSFFFFIPAASADVYMKSKVMSGMGESEVWTSGKKQRMSVNAGSLGNLMGNEIQITRVDKGVKWTLNTKLKAYQEEPLAMPYKKEDSDEKLTPDEERQLKELEKKMDQGLGEASEQAPCDKVVNAGVRTIGGFQATGFRSGCQQPEQGPVATIWMANAGQGKIDQIQKETEVFETAQMEAMYANFPKEERERTIKVMKLFGKAMAGGLMGMPNFEKLPKTIPLAMEQDAASGETRKNVIMEVVALDVVPADAGRYEIPEDYKKVENIHEMMGQAMFDGMANGNVKLSDVLGGMQDMAGKAGMPASEMASKEDLTGADEFGQKITNAIREEAQLQGQYPNPPARQYPSGNDSGNAESDTAQSEPSQQQQSAADGTEDATEEWQQGLYNQPPPQQQQAQQNVNYQQQAPQQMQYQQVPPQQQQYPQQAQRRRRASGQQNTQQTLQQVQGILNSVQGIASSFSGGGYGSFPTGGNFGGYEMPDGYSDGSGDYGDYSSEDSGDSGYSDESYQEQSTE